MIFLRKFLSHELGLIAITVSFYVAVVGLALAPSGTVPDLPGFSDKAQHVMAFFCLGAVTVFGTTEPTGFRRACFSLILFAAALELCQHFSPGRSVSFADFVASSIGVALGTTLAGLAQRFRGRRPTPGRFGSLDGCDA